MTCSTHFEALWYSLHIPVALRNSSHTASVTPAVFDIPPRSGVKMPALQTRSMDLIKVSAASFSPSHDSISAADQNVATGLAIPLPVISNALPWTGSKMEGFFLVGSKFEDGATPIDPAKAAAKSEIWLQGQ